MVRRFVIPVYLPTDDGGVNTGFELGFGHLSNGNLIVEFNNKLPSVAIRRMLERGQLMGISFVLPAADDAPMTQEEKDAVDLALLGANEEISPDVIANTQAE